jgi:hypothetical protein
VRLLESLHGGGGEPFCFLVGIASVMRAVSGTGACGKSRSATATRRAGALASERKAQAVLLLPMRC